MEAKIVKLADGRDLAYAEFGDPDGIPLFFAHGGPGSHNEGNFFHEAALKQGFRFIVTDRPGMGDSTFLENRILLDYPKDISELADILGIDKFGVLGWSGGGAHTTVCAYAIPDRLLFNYTCAGYTNFAELPGAEKYLQSKMDQVAVGLSKSHPKLFKAFFDMMRLADKYMPDYFYESMMKETSSTDQQIFKDENFHKVFMEDMAEAFKNGSRGVTTDAAVHYVDWGFRLKQISMKITIFHGTDDLLVPYLFGKHISEKVQNCTLHTLKGEGHLFPYLRAEEILKHAKEEI